MITSADYRAAARAKLAGNWVPVIIGTLICQAILGALSFTGVGTLLLTGPIMLGLDIFYLAYSRGYTPEYRILFSGLETNFLQSFLICLMTGIFTILWSMLFVIPGIIKAYSYSMAYYILADHPEYTWKECMDESVEIMQGNKMRLFCLQLSFLGWIILCAMTFGILTFWVVPYQNMATVEFYNSIKRR